MNTGIPINNLPKPSKKRDTGEGGDSPTKKKAKVEKPTFSRPDSEDYVKVFHLSGALKSSILENYATNDEDNDSDDSLGELINI